jgi:hypothetical protein
MKPWHLLGWIVALAGLTCALIWAAGLLPFHPVPRLQEPDVPPWLADVTDAVGLDFVHDAGPLPTGRYFMPQALGSGAALFDFDGDDRLDVYLLQNGGPKGAKNRLFRQTNRGRFEEVANSGLDIAGYNMGVAVGDVNNDGRLDVLVTQYGGIQLFLNQGKGRFTNVTREAGLENTGWGMSAAFFDYDRDGWLDLVVVNYIDYDPSWPCTSSGKPEYCPPSTFKGQVTRLFRNLGPGKDDKVRFQDRTVASGLNARAGPGLGVLCADFNGDGWPDVFVANDGKPNHLWINRHDGTFREEALQRGVAFNGMAQAEAGMGVAYGDVDGDGLPDLFVTHLRQETHTLWKQVSPGLFHDQTMFFGLARTRWRGTGFGTILADFDHNGMSDIAVVNGAIARGSVMENPALGSHWGFYAEHNQLFANEGRGQFRDISADNHDFCSTPRVARGLACGDMDNDGALDLLVTNVAGPARLYRNVAPRRGHWLMVRAVDPQLRRDAIGAEIRIRAAGQTWIRLINPAASYLSSSDLRAHFGFGPLACVEEIEVTWPKGEKEVFACGSLDRPITLEKGKGTRIVRPSGSGADRAPPREKSP